jgi:biopolymer transport protein TolR
MPAANHKRRVMAEINVVPYIDVMLVLLIIFMVTAPLLKQGVDVDLPQAPAKALDVDSPEPVIISVDAKGLVFLNISPTAEVPVDTTQLVEQVKNALAKQKNRPVMVRGDKNVIYQNVVDVLVNLQQAGIDSVGLVTEPGEQQQ